MGGSMRGSQRWEPFSPLPRKPQALKRGGPGWASALAFLGGVQGRSPARCPAFGMPFTHAGGMGKGTVGLMDVRSLDELGAQ